MRLRLAIVDAFRGEADDRARMEDLECEFPFFAQRYGLRGVALMDLADNQAGAFKWRGAVTGLVHHMEDGADHFVAPSAGNHARGAILAARWFNQHLTVAVPSSAPPSKREMLNELWGSHMLDVRTVGATFNDSLAWALSSPYAMLHPFDDEAVMAGQGTALDDVLAGRPETQHVVLPSGGAGLGGGVVRRRDELGRQDVAIHLVQASGSNSLSNSLQRGELTSADAPNHLYGGAHVERVGVHPLTQVARGENVFVHTVPEADMDELRDLYSHGREVLLREDTPNFEPTSLLAVAALKRLQLTGDVTVLGTGKNDSIYPQTAARGRRNMVWYGPQAA